MKIIFVLSFFFFNLARAGTVMKLEGECSGKINEVPFSFKYFSNFDGCRNRSAAALSFTDGNERLYTGTRSFKGFKDVYQLGIRSETIKLEFANSTGNTKGRFIHNSKAVTVQCNIRDYEYGDCR